MYNDSSLSLFFFVSLDVEILINQKFKHSADINEQYVFVRMNGKNILFIRL